MAPRPAVAAVLRNRYSSQVAWDQQSDRPGKGWRRKGKEAQAAVAREVKASEELIRQAAAVADYAEELADAVGWQPSGSIVARYSRMAVRPEWCRDHGENYDAVKHALYRAYGGPTPRALGKPKQAKGGADGDSMSPLPQPSEEAVRHAAGWQPRATHNCVGRQAQAGVPATPPGASGA